MLAFLALGFFGAFCGCASHSLSVQKKDSTQDTLIPVSALREDVDFLAKTLCEVHFELSGASNRVAELRSAAEGVKAGLTEPLTQAQLFVRLAPLVTGLEDGHTQIHLPWRSLEAYKRNGGTVIPLDVAFLEGRVYVLRNYATNSAIAPGAELLAINAVPINEIMTRLSGALAGERQAFRFAFLAGIANDRFKMLLWVEYGFRDTFDIRYRQDGVIREARLPGLNSETLQVRRENSGKPSLPFRYLPQGEHIGLMEIKTFGAGDGEYGRFLKETFKRIRAEGVEHLIIDVRGNLGGSSDQAGELLSYLATNPVAVAPIAEVRVSAQAKKQFKKRIPGAVRWLPLQYLSSRGGAVWNAPEGSVVTFQEKPTALKPEKRRYHGKVYLLVDEATFSTAAILADVMKRNGLGLLIGRETGGLADRTLGEPLFFETPNSGIGFTVSAMRLKQSAANLLAQPRGVVPDRIVDKNLDDEIHGTDTVLEKAKALIYSETADDRDKQGQRPEPAFARVDHITAPKRE